MVRFHLPRGLALVLALFFCCCVARAPPSANHAVRESQLVALRESLPARRAMLSIRSSESVYCCATSAVECLRQPSTCSLMRDKH